MDAVEFLLILFNVILCVLYSDAALTDNTLQACYGNGFEDYLTPSCSSGEKIYIYDVFVYAKHRSLNCPTTATFADRNITYCCNYVNQKEDCGQRYFGTAGEFEHAHYSRCTGLATCGGIQVAWNYTEHFCNITVYADRTNYMKMWYNCIPDSSSLSINSVSTLTSDAVFLLSENYPSMMSECSTTSGATCRVQTSNGSPLQITALDIQLSETSGVCQQRIYITDGSTNSEINCEDNNNFVKRVVFTSSSSAIEIRLDNTATTTAGKFWIQIEATQNSGRVSIECINATAMFGCGSSIAISNGTSVANSSSSNITDSTTTTTSSVQLNFTNSENTSTSSSLTSTASDAGTSTTTASSVVTETSTNITDNTTTTTSSVQLNSINSENTSTSSSLTSTASDAGTSTTTASSVVTETSTNSSSNTSLTNQDSGRSLDLTWVLTIFPGALASGVIFGSIAYTLYSCKKRFFQGNFTKVKKFNM
ncbi:uncharacterized protein DDB_G0271670-like [Saccostrea cucullata]|uniref:uncharacterized protein DDB_G0271670-like n=1 Tax=Saccostrea cuccullata TaxID=36930 RepID=UPI002ED4F151